MHAITRFRCTANGTFLILIIGLLAGTISGIIGTGSSIMLVPVLAYVYGPKEAVPIMAVAAVMANISRILCGGGKLIGGLWQPMRLPAFQRQFLVREPCLFSRPEQ